MPRKSYGRLPSPSSPFPWYITHAVNVVWQKYAIDLMGMPKIHRTRIMMAALDAEKEGRASVTAAVCETMRDVLREKYRSEGLA